MNGPDIFIVILESGDGYGHGSSEYVAWFFSENEANTDADKRNSELKTSFKRYVVERVRAGGKDDSADE